MAHTDTQPIALVTGANKGIGYEIARKLANAGTTVLLGARDPGRGEAAAAALARDGVSAIPIQLDITDPGSIEAAVSQLSEQYGRLDILVNNAGIIASGDGKPSQTSPEVVRHAFETNFFGTLAITQAMLPLLHKAEAARIINVSSSLGSLQLNGDPSWPAYEVKLIGYNAAKAALNMLTVQLAAELADTAITVQSVCPGLTATDLNGHMGDRQPAEGAEAPAHAALANDTTSGQFFDAEGPLPW